MVEGHVLPQSVLLGGGYAHLESEGLVGLSVGRGDSFDVVWVQSHQFQKVVQGGGM